VARTSVIAAFRYHEPHTAGRIVDVPRVSRDQVHVQVHDRLARGFAVIDADVVPGRGELAVQSMFHTIDECHDRLPLLSAGIEPGREVATREDERVADIDGEGVANGEGAIVGCDDGCCRRAEGAARSRRRAHDGKTIPRQRDGGSGQSQRFLHNAWRWCMAIGRPSEWHERAYRA
jgi:hypothetical protein